MQLQGSQHSIKSLPNPKTYFKNIRDVEGQDRYLPSHVVIPGIRMGKSQEVETLFNEEALLFATYPRRKSKEWIPRLPKLSPQPYNAKNN
jgi:hypothetical protein